MTRPSKKASESIAVCSRLTSTFDANPGGNVHGGVIMQIMEETGFISAARHSGLAVVSACIDAVNFITPVFIGEIITVEAKVTFASLRSVETRVEVRPENPITGEKRLSNVAYVVFTAPPDARGDHVMPTVEAETEAEAVELEAGRHRYEARKLRRETGTSPRSWLAGPFAEACAESPNGSAQTIMTHLTLPAEAGATGLVRGGIGLKLIDSTAGVCAYRWCRTPVVTASMESTDLLSPVRVGELLKLRARVTFTSARSVEVTVVMEAENAREASTRLVAHSVLVFVSLGPAPDRKVLPVPQLVPSTPAETALFQKALQKYNDRRQKKETTK